MPYSMSPSNGQVNRVDRLIINLDTTMPLGCAWDDCEKRARTPYQVRTHEHQGKCDSPEARHGRHAIYAFCSERCRLYWLNASGTNAHRAAGENRGGRIYGQLPAGLRNRI
jgi:endogenous inhibitor of DNA gyrase (YacG/DUF329 family)